MSNYTIDPGQVNRVCTGVLREFGQGNFDSAELIIGLAEAIGRVIVETGKTPIGMNDLKKIVEDHLNRTIAAGCRAKGFGHAPTH